MPWEDVGSTILGHLRRSFFKSKNVGMKPIANIIIVISMAAARSACAQIAECDLLASSPLDPQKQSAGVTYGRLNHIAAVPACKLAVSENKQAARLWFQYGRALEKAKKLPDAIIAYQEAAKLGSGAAYNNLGELYRDGKGFDADLKLAEEFFKKASDLNSIEGRDNLLNLQSKIKPTNLKPDPEIAEILYEVQLAAFKSNDDAALKVLDLSKNRIFAYISAYPEGSVFRVRRGPFISLEDANKDIDYLLANGIVATIIKSNSSQPLRSLLSSNTERINRERGEYSQRNQFGENNPTVGKGEKSADSASGLKKLEAASVQVQNYSNGFCGALLLRTSGLIDKLGPAHVASNSQEGRNLQKLNFYIKDAGFLLTLKGAADGSFVTDGDRGKKLAEDTLGSDLLPLVNTNSVFHKSMMSCYERVKN